MSALPTGAHVLSLDSTGQRTGGMRTELLTGKCSCARWKHPQSTREIIRSAHAAHLDEAIASGAEVRDGC